MSPAAADCASADGALEEFDPDPHADRSAMEITETRNRARALVENFMRRWCARIGEKLLNRARLQPASAVSRALVRRSSGAPCHPRGMNAIAAPRRTAGEIGRQMLNKVPEITLYFWVIKVLCTTVGETFA